MAEVPEEFLNDPAVKVFKVGATPLGAGWNQGESEEGAEYGDD